MSIRLIPCFILTAVLGLMLTGASDLMAQGGGDTGTPTIPVVQPTTPTVDPTQQGSGAATTARNVAPIGDLIDIETTPDQRNQGFVGATANRIQDLGFVGRPGETAGPGLAADATYGFGGGVNNSVRNNITISPAAPAENGFSVQRQSVRARVRPNFYSAPRSGQTVVSNFNNHFVQQPGFNSIRGNYSINVQDRTAFINGSVGSQADSVRLERQLRLEPGVYKIVNQLQVLK